MHKNNAILPISSSTLPTPFLSLFFILAFFTQGCSSDKSGTMDPIPTTDAVTVRPNIDSGGMDSGEPVQDKICRSSNGKRLVREYINPSGAGLQEFNIIDSQYDVACTYLPVGDGSFTCYPTRYGGELFFEDSNCEDALVGVERKSRPLAFHRADKVLNIGCSESRLRMYRKIGKARTVGRKVYFKVGARCYDIKRPDMDFYGAGPVLPSSAFVNAIGTRYTNETRLSELVLSGSDNSSMCSQSAVVSDSEFGQLCMSHLASDSNYHCLPFGEIPKNIYTDGLCSTTVDVVVVSKECKGRPTFAWKSALKDCKQTTTQVYKLSGSVESSRYEKKDGVCSNVSKEEEQYYRVGDEILPSGLASLTAVVEDSSQRLHRQVMKSPDGFTQFLGTWSDSELGFTCSFRAAADGNQRCLPIATRLKSQIFNDKQCLVKVKLAEIDSCNKKLEFVSFSINGLERVYKAETFTETAYYRKNGKCKVLDGQFVKAGEELLIKSLVKAEIKTE